MILLGNGILYYRLYDEDEEYWRHNCEDAYWEVDNFNDTERQFRSYHFWLGAII